MFRLFIHLKRLQQTENRQLIDAKKKNKIEKLHNDGRILVLKSPLTWKREKKTYLGYYDKKCEWSACTNIQPLWKKYFAQFHPDIPLPLTLSIGTIVMAASLHCMLLLSTPANVDQHSLSLIGWIPFHWKICSVIKITPEPMQKIEQFIVPSVVL